MIIESSGTPLLYGGFLLLVVVLLTLDFVVLKTQGNHRVSVKEAALWSIVWVSIALAFGGWLWWYLNGRFGAEVAWEKSMQYLAGYLIEKSLAVDNVFVWITLFGFFSVPVQYQKRVLLYGVLGAIVMRGILIYVGAFLLATFHWILYVFGVFLLLTGVKMLLFSAQEPDIEKNPMLRLIRRFFKITDDYHKEQFFVIKSGVRYATPLFVVLILVEMTDLIFAVDSIPAIFAVTNDPFIVFTSNIFAILGLRAMYFLLVDLADRFHLLKYGLALILMFIGGKMLLLDIYKIPVALALGAVGLILASSIVASLVVVKQQAPGKGSKS